MCTTTIVTPGASADGCMYVSHSDDSDLSDASVVFVPGRNWREGSVRPVYPSAVYDSDIPEYNAFLIPRLADPDRAPGYSHPNTLPTLPLGAIPQEGATYAYLDGSYGIANEAGLMFGECTNGVHRQTNPVKDGGWFYASELSRVALERCDNARDAVLLMGDLMEQYGLYGTGETLPVADGHEAWVLEMAPAPKGCDGPLWVAQRVPDGEVFVAANEFRIRDVSPDNPDQLIGSFVMPYVNKKRNKPEDCADAFDWLPLVSAGEYSHPYYSLRRVWRALSLVAPSRKFPAWVDNGLTRAYPFSVAPDKKVRLEDIKNIHRDHYEETEFDLTKGAAAGPFGNPNRYLGPRDPSGDVGDPDVKLDGAWERALSMYYIGFTYICQHNPKLPYPINTICWMALNTPAESVFVPLAVRPVPPSYESGDPREFSWDSAWSVYNLIGEYANLKYSYMIKDIQARASRHERQSRDLVADLQKTLLSEARENPEHAAREFGAALAANAENIRLDWRFFFGELVVKYRQGFVNTPSAMAGKVGYPAEWLAGTNYASGPVKYTKH